MSAPSVAVLCVTHGRPALVKTCLQSCARQDYENFEIVVVINPADAVTEQSVIAAAPSARIMRTHRNLGFAPVLNIAIASIDADYIMFVDDDAWFLADDALSRLVDEFRRDPSLGAVTCNLEGPHETPITGGDRYIRAFTTGFTMIPRAAVTDWVGYFPDIFFRASEESFLCAKLWQQGRPVKRVEAVRMHHAFAQQGRSTRDFWFHAIRSQVLCAIMREPAGWLLPVLASKFIKSFIQCARQGHLLIWLHAWASSLVNAPDALRRRDPVSPAARRLLARLDASEVRDLAACREWNALHPLAQCAPAF